MNFGPPLSFTLATTLNTTVSDLRGRIAATSQEIATGRRSDLISHLDGRIGSAMLSQRAIEQIADERMTLELRSSRLEIAQAALENLQGLAAELPNRMQSAAQFGDQPAMEQAAEDAKAALDQAMNIMNTRHGERYLFSGDATATAPFGDEDVLLNDLRTIVLAAPDSVSLENALDTYFNSPAGGWQTRIYSGTSTASNPDAVTGTAPAVVETIRGLAMTALAAPSENMPFLGAGESNFDQAMASLREANSLLISQRASIGTSLDSIATAQQMLDTEETLLTTAFNEIAGRDQFEAATELRELERNLEASYLLTSRLANFSLLNYLR